MVSESEKSQAEHNPHSGKFRNEDHITNMVQIATSFALVLGLVLVLLELQQAKSLTLAELTSEGYSEAMEISRVVLGENSAEVLAKSCFSPGELTPAEAIIVDLYFDTRLLMLDRLRTLEGVAEFGVPWQAFVYPFIDDIFGSEHGRWWLRNNPPADAETRELVAEVIQTRDCTNYFERFARLQDLPVATANSQLNPLN